MPIGAPPSLFNNNYATKHSIGIFALFRVCNGTGGNIPQWPYGCEILARGQWRAYL